jgi:adenosine kinase
MNIIVTGSIAYDYLMRFPGRFIEHILADQLHTLSVSFLVEDMTKHWGGIGANIAYTLGLFGMQPRLFGTVGRDFGDYHEWLERAGVDLRMVRKLDDVFTASFFVNTDLDNNQIASFYSGAMQRARHFSIRETLEAEDIGQPDLVIISPNDPVAMQNYAAECRQHGWRFVYDPSQQVPRLSGEELTASMEGAYAMTVNAFEAAMISEKTRLTLDELRRRVDVLVVTQGKHGSHIYTDGQRLDIAPAQVDAILDPTGVGDAYRAGLISGIAHGYPLQLAGQMGSLCAAYVLEQVGPQGHHFTMAEFITRFRHNFDDRGQLDQLLSASAAD